jgi:hypothetical protein
MEISFKFWEAEFWEGREGKENFTLAEEKINKSKGMPAGMTLGITNIDAVI